MKKLAVIGCGHWGSNHIRVFSSIKGVKIVMVSDLSKKILKKISFRYPNLIRTPNYKDIMKNNDIDAVIVATNAKSHHKIVKECLLNKKDVLCEKPLTLNTKECEELIQIAKRNKLILMVGHVFLHNNGIIALKKYITSNEIGELLYIHTTRTNLGPIRNDVNAVYDLATHDISILNYLLGSEPTDVDVKGKCYLQKNIEDVAFISLSYPRNILCNIHVSWLAPGKTRQIVIVGDKKMICWDDINSETIKIFNKGVTKEKEYDDYGQFQLNTRDDGIIIPKMDLQEPLLAEAKYFINCLNTRNINLNNGIEALKVVKVLDLLNKQLNN